MSSPTPEHLTQLISVRAGAGAGKTTELVARVVAYAQHIKNTENRYPRIVVTTFTRKATQELRERLQKKALELGDPELFKYVQKRSSLHISTIHGILSLYLQKYGNFLELSPKFSIIDPFVEIKLIKKILKNLLNDPENALKVERLLEERKFSGLAEDIKKYFEIRSEKNKPLEFVGVKEVFNAANIYIENWMESAKAFLAEAEATQTGKLWPELIQRMQTLLQNLLKEREIPRRLQLIVEFDQQKESVRLSKASDELKKLRSTVFDGLKDFSRKSWLWSAEWVELYQQLTTSFQNIAELAYYEILQSKLVTGMITMTDLEILSMVLMKKNPQSAAHFSKEWDYWFIDEYQDTSPRQVELLEQLIGTQNHFVVGDPQQSIYLFRGARSEVFHNKREQIRKRQGVLLEKMENYRSDPSLLYFFNHFFTHLGQQFSSMNPGKLLNSDTKMPVARYIQCQDQSETTALIEQACELIHNGVKPEQICILSRSNRFLNKIADEAQKIRLPVQVHAASQFAARREILDAISLLKFLVNPSDNLNLLELLRTPWFRVSDSLIVQSLSQTKEQRFWNQIEATLIQEPVIELLCDLRRQIDVVGISRAWIHGLRRSGFIDFLAQLDSSGRKEANLWKLMTELTFAERKPGFNYIDFINSLQFAAATTEEAGSIDATPVIQPQRVNLMTVHASKGLQFEHVLIADMGSLRLQKKPEFLLYDEKNDKLTLSLIDPDQGKLTAHFYADFVLEEKKQREFEEYDRVLYVALTRAQQSVTLVWSKTAKDSWASRMWIPSDGLQHHEKFTTLKVVDHLPDIKQKEVLAVSQIREIPILKSERNKDLKGSFSVTKMLEKNKPQVAGANIGHIIESAQFGVSTHRLLESLKYNRPEVLSVSPSQKGALDFIKSWENGKIIDWIKGGEVEYGFCISLGEQLIQGQIDLWWSDESSYVVVDYKTGSEQYIESAFSQLQIYAWALRKMKKVSEGQKGHLIVVYPFSKKVYKRPVDLAFAPQ